MGSKRNYNYINMELTTLEMLMLAPLTNRIIQSPTAPDKLKAAYTALKERMTDELCKVDEREVIADFEDIGRMDPSQGEELKQKIDLIRLLATIKKAFTHE